MDIKKSKFMILDFEQYLQEKFWEAEPMTLDDQFPDAFDSWLEQLDNQEIIDYGQKYAEFIFNQQ